MQYFIALTKINQPCTNGQMPTWYDSSLECTKAGHAPHPVCLFVHSTERHTMVLQSQFLSIAAAVAVPKAVVTSQGLWHSWVF